MTTRARMWAGVTLLLIIGFNYGMIWFSLHAKTTSIEKQYRTIVVNQVKSGKILQSGNDSYVLDMLRKEKSAIDGKTRILNCAAASATILVASWVLFGLLAKRKK